MFTVCCVWQCVSSVCEDIRWSQRLFHPQICHCFSFWMCKYSYISNQGLKYTDCMPFSLWKRHTNTHTPYVSRFWSMHIRIFIDVTPAHLRGCCHCSYANAHLIVRTKPERSSEGSLVRIAARKVPGGSGVLSLHCMFLGQSKKRNSQTTFTFPPALYPFHVHLSTIKNLVDGPNCLFTSCLFLFHLFFSRFPLHSFSSL